MFGPEYFHTFVQTGLPECFIRGKLDLFVNEDKTISFTRGTYGLLLTSAFLIEGWKYLVY